MGLTRRYIERNLLDEIAGIKRRLAILERGDVETQAIAEATGLILYEETTGRPYELVARIEAGKCRLYLRPPADVGLNAAFATTEAA